MMEQEREPTRRENREYEPPTLVDLGEVDKFSQGDSRTSIDDQ